MENVRPGAVISDRAWPLIGAYSHAMVWGDLVFSSGFGPQDPATGNIPEGIEAQVNATLDALALVLNEVGSSLDSVLKLTIHLADVERDFATFDRVIGARFNAPYPVRTTVRSGLLGILVEIDVVAGIEKPTVDAN